MSSATTVSEIQVQRMRLRVAMSAVVGPATFDHTERVAICSLAMAIFLMYVKRLIGIQLSQCARAQYLMGFAWASNAGSSVLLEPSEIAMAKSGVCLQCWRSPPRRQLTEPA